MSGTIDPASHLGARAARRVQRDLDYVAKQLRHSRVSEGVLNGDGASALPDYGHVADWHAFTSRMYCVLGGRDGPRTAAV